MVDSDQALKGKRPGREDRRRAGDTRGAAGGRSGGGRERGLEGGLCDAGLLPLALLGFVAACAGVFGLGLGEEFQAASVMGAFVARGERGRGEFGEEDCVEALRGVRGEVGGGED
ncbi:hypothetical protein CNMCM6106_000530 [Aspergillus hiratsukae]|uniref:Uncharacterized protein n=1 Tax=Aspergillus hiratsukae TaxID=1194566 RepID=A0A8H6V5I2_9EURO|nr:hypothetical protein CNMCM6106_000530 [Aspergillus hiratsukae]